MLLPSVISSLLSPRCLRSSSFVVSLSLETRFYFIWIYYRSVFYCRTGDCTRTFPLAIIKFQTCTYFILSIKSVYYSAAIKTRPCVLPTRGECPDLRLDRAVTSARARVSRFVFKESSDRQLRLLATFHHRKSTARAVYSTYTFYPLPCLFLFFFSEAQTSDFLTYAFLLSSISRICVRCGDIFVKEESTSHQTKV